MQKIIDTLIFMWIIYCEGLTFPKNMVIKTKSGRFFLLHSDYEEKNEPTVISPPDVTSTGPETTTEITTSPPAINSVPDVTTTGLETTIEITTSMTDIMGGNIGEFVEEYEDPVTTETETTTNSSTVRCAGEYGDCCNSSHPCDVGDGDCDVNEDCMEGLTCGIDNCSQFGVLYAANDDCCQKSDVYGETTAQPKGSDYMVTANEALPEGDYTDGSNVTMVEEEYDGEAEDYEQNWVNNDYYYD